MSSDSGFRSACRVVVAANGPGACTSYGTAHRRAMLKSGARRGPAAPDGRLDYVMQNGLEITTYRWRQLNVFTLRVVSTTSSQSAL